MTRIIGSTYEIVGQLGAGGGGIVYLADHIRLNKQVVLKADRRKITTPPALLRREVDVLKDLKHPYIPQVYDFFSEGETVYTAMDYIDGTSLDKALKEYGRFSQPQVISWAKQLLQALDYLHSPTHGSPPRGYVHSDIKPANLMLRPNGDICLIDFNISLALGEENVIGASAGYASPEHYGLDFSLYSSLTETQADGTVAMRDETETLTMPQTNRKIRPDIRSDIYSTGATLYHLLSGRKPAKSALEVTPLTEREASPQIARIIAKAMEPNAALRYQTAGEMLWDLEHLHMNDLRMKRYRRMLKATAAGLSVAFALGGVMTFVGLRRMERIQAQERITAQRSEQALAAVSASEAAFRGGDIPTAVQQASAALELDSIYAPQAQRALTDALGVYELTDGLKSHLLLPLPSEPTKAVLSPEGTRAAAITTGQLHVFDTETGETLAELPTDPSALSDVVFADEDMVLYAGDGALCAYDLAAQTALWTGRPATAITLSADRSTVAALYKDEDRAVVYRAASGEVLNTVSFDGKRQGVLANDQFTDPEDALFALNQDGSRLAVSFSDGALRLFDWSDPENCLTFFDTSDYVHFAGGFSGQYFAFSATERSGASVFVVFDMKSLQQVGGLSAATPFLASADESGVYVAQEDLLVRMELETASDSELAYTNGDTLSYAVAEDYTLAASENGELTLFGAGAAPLMTYTGDEPYQILDLAGAYGMAASTGRPELRILKVENHTDAQIFTYDASVPHREARLSEDRNTVMLFQYDRFHLYALDGTLLANEALPDASTIFDQQYRRDERGSYLEVTYYSGLVRCYSALDGSVISETTGTAPDPDAPIAYLTAHWRILAPQHGPPEVYDLESGALLGTLESSDYLTYVTQVGDFVITEYVTAQGLRYGLLLDDSRNTLARLPNLSDVLEDGTLVFDDQYGNLRQSRIYSIAELMALAKR